MAHELAQHSKIRRVFQDGSKHTKLHAYPGGPKDYGTLRKYLAKALRERVLWGRR